MSAFDPKRRGGGGCAFLAASPPPTKAQNSRQAGGSFSSAQSRKVRTGLAQVTSLRRSWLEKRPLGLADGRLIAIMTRRRRPKLLSGQCLCRTVPDQQQASRC